MSLKRILDVFGGVGENLLKAEMPPPRPKPQPATVGPENEQWAMLAKPAEEWDLEGMYTAARGGPPNSAPYVAIVVPGYRESERIARAGRVSRNEVRKDLDAHGIASGTGSIEGDSLVCRMRQRACHMFLMSPATHLLFWDADIECLTVDCVRHMLASGHDVVAGACPFKDKGGRTVHNLFPDDNDRPKIGADGCVEVQDAGTGFMLIHRKALVTLQQAHPERLHWSLSGGADRGAPLWSLFNTEVVGGVYQSEDYLFCHLWQEAGGKVYVYAPARFRHWGEHGFEGSFLEQYGVTAVKEAAE